MAQGCPRALSLRGQPSGALRFLHMPAYDVPAIIAAMVPLLKFVADLVVPLAMLLSQWGKAVLENPWHTFAVLIGSVLVALALRFALKWGIALLAIILLGGGLWWAWHWVLERGDQTVTNADGALFQLAALSGEEKGGGKNGLFNETEEVCDPLPRKDDTLARGLLLFNRLSNSCNREYLFVHVQYQSGAAEWLNITRKASKATLLSDVGLFCRIAREMVDGTIKALALVHNHPRLPLGGAVVSMPPSGADLISFHAFAVDLLGKGLPRKALGGRFVSVVTDPVGYWIISPNADHDYYVAKELFDERVCSFKGDIPLPSVSVERISGPLPQTREALEARLSELAEADRAVHARDAKERKQRSALLNRFRRGEIASPEMVVAEILEAGAFSRLRALDRMLIEASMRLNELEETSRGARGDRAFHETRAGLWQHIYLNFSTRRSVLRDLDYVTIQYLTNPAEWARRWEAR